MRTLTRAAVRRALPRPAVNRARELRTILHERAADRASPLLFAFPGGTGSREGMGRQLCKTEPAFKDSVDACSQVAEDLLGFAAARVFRGDVSVDTAADFQTAWRNKTVLLGIVQVALWDLWQASGISADGVLGLSLGDITAAYPAGALSREDTMAVVCSIARRTSERPRKGEIVVVSADADAAKSLAQAAPTPLAFLGEVGPQMTVLIGATEDTSAATEFIASSVPVVQRLETDWTYHTMLAPFDREEMLGDLRDIAPGPIRLPYYSSVIGGLLPEDAILDGSHWYWLVSRPFYYGSALAAALRDGFRVIVNLAPHPVMNATIRQTASALGLPVRLMDTMRASEPELVTWRRAKGQLRERPSASWRRRLRAIAEEPPEALVARFEVDDPQFARDPYRYLQKLREAAPVHYLPRRRCWLVVGFEPARAVLANAADYSSCDMAEVEPALLGADGEAHVATRRVLARRFSAAVISTTATYAEQLSDQLLCALVEWSEFDVVRELSIPLSARVAGRLLELDEVSLSQLEANLEGPPRPTGVAMAHTRPVLESLAERIPLYARLRGEHGYEHSVAVGLITLLWVAAANTTVSAIGNSVRRIADRSVRGEIKSRPDLLPRFVEESLRLEPPGHVIARRAVRDLELAGIEIPANSSVLVTPGAANRDPARFGDPDRVILERANERDHLTFSAGPHHCLGARLARIEMRAALAALLRLMPDFELAQPRHTIRYMGTSSRTLEQLIIKPGSAT